MKKKYMSIGDLSKLSGVSIKSLRYYDSIGILHPAYVDTNTGYRYYTKTQLYLLDAIQFCIDLDIPLKEFNRFISDDGNAIHYSELVSHGKKLATEKIKHINNRLSFLEMLQKEFDRCSSVTREEAECYPMDNLYCHIVPFNDSQDSGTFFDTLKKELLSISSAEVNPTTEIGIVRLIDRGVSQKYIYYTIRDKVFETNLEERQLVLPNGNYLCIEVDCGDIDKAEEIFSINPNSKSIVVETELFPQTFDFSCPHYELRYIEL